MAESIRTKQYEILDRLIDKLRSISSEEDNLNGRAILQDMLEHKEFLDNFCTSDKVEKLIEIGFIRSEGDDDLNSRTAAI